MPTLTDSMDAITLACSPEKDGDTIVFTYSLANAGQADAYASDAEPAFDKAARAWIAAPDGVAVWRGAEAHACILKGVPPLPVDRILLYHARPLMVAMVPGARIERRLTLRLPLAEHSPYFGIGPVQDYRLTEIEAIRLAIDIVTAPPPPFEAKPVPYAPDYVEFGRHSPVSLYRRLSCTLRTRGLHLLMRRDTYPRPEE
jgi:hypothetical protein